RDRIALIFGGPRSPTIAVVIVQAEVGKDMRQGMIVPTPGRFLLLRFNLLLLEPNPRPPERALGDASEPDVPIEAELRTPVQKACGGEDHRKPIIIIVIILLRGLSLLRLPRIRLLLDLILGRPRRTHGAAGTALRVDGRGAAGLALPSGVD